MNIPFYDRLSEIFQDKNFKKSLILWYRYAKGLNPKQICEELNMSISTVYFVLKKWTEFGSINHGNFEKNNSSLRQKTIDKIIQIQKQDRFMSVKDIHKQIVKNETQNNIKKQTSYWQVLRIINSNFKTKPCYYKINLSERNMFKRLIWIQKYKKWARWKFKKVLWTDEKKFELYKQGSRIKVKILLNESRKDFSLKKVHSGGGSIMVWGAINYNGVICLKKISSIFTSENFKNFLRFQALPIIKKKLGNDFIFQQDNAPCHMGLTKKFLENQPFEILEWPAQSPDLNPIELVWMWMNDKLKVQSFQNLKELEKRIFFLWENINLDIIQKFIDALPKKMEWIESNNGDIFKD